MTVVEVGVKELEGTDAPTDAFIIWASFSSHCLALIASFPWLWAQTKSDVIRGEWESVC